MTPIDAAGTVTDTRNPLDRTEEAHVIHYDGAYTVRAGLTQLTHTMPLWDAHLLATVHNECRENQAFAKRLRRTVNA